jgi:hypothetical protein
MDRAVSPALRPRRHAAEDMAFFSAFPPHRFML